MNDASPRMVFVISAPRSGSTMLERMLEAHPQIKGGPEPHIMTPLAHLGPWAKVEKAPYDHILAAEAQRGFIEALPGKMDDYWAACRAYCDTLYGRYVGPTGEPFCLDKTPAYALVAPFIAKVYPDARYVVLTRHPAALFSSFANSFFDGSYETAHAHNALLERYVPALAAFIRQPDPDSLHVRYEDLVHAPEDWMRRICAYVGVPFAARMVDYGARTEASPETPRKGLGDPIGVGQHRRPTTASVEKWAGELAADADKRRFMESVVARLDPDDLATLGYPLETFWDPLTAAGAEPARPRPQPLTRYRLQRKLIVGLREQARRRRPFRKALEKARLACDVLLREG